MLAQAADCQSSLVNTRCCGAIMCTGPQEKLITAQICGETVEVALHQACLPANVASIT
jgi:hypothetical protein